MRVFKVNYFTFGRGREAEGVIGNIKQFDDVAFIECSNTSTIDRSLKEHYAKNPRGGIYFYPVIDKITVEKGHIVANSES